MGAIEALMTREFLIAIRIAAMASQIMPSVVVNIGTM